jgi:5-(carboxyamino)imidazole ribonucleotide mutase
VANPIVSVVMGSESDWDTMRASVEILTRFEIPHEARVVSAHRTPERMVEYALEASGRGIEVIIAGAGGAAHLPGMISSLTSLPVLGVPVRSQMLAGVDSLLSIVQMPAGVPTATFSIGPAGATNAALFAARILALHDAELGQRLAEYREAQADKVIAARLPPTDKP